MRINPVITSKIIPLNPHNYEKEEKKTSAKNMIRFPFSYGFSNIAFCGVKTKKAKASEAKENAMPKLIKAELPIFAPYNDTIINSLKNLLSDGKCVISYNKYIDSLDIFKENLRSFIDTNQLEKLGFNRNTTFLEINLADYAEDYKNAFKNLSKDLNRLIKPNIKPIIFAKGISSLFDRIDRPNDFFESSIFRKYPTIFFMEEGYDSMKIADLEIIKMGLNPELIPKNGYVDQPEFKHLLSKFTFLKNASNEQLSFPSVDYTNIIGYLLNKIVQKELINKGNEIYYEDGVIELAMEWGKTSSYYKNDFTNPNHEERLLNEETIPIQSTIDILKKAVALKLILKPDAKNLTINDLMASFPSGINWISMLAKFKTLQKRMLIDKKEAPKNTTEQNNDNQTIEENKQTPTQKETSTADEIISKGGFEIVHNPKTKFSDIGGMYNIKKQLKEEFIDILKNPIVKNSQKPSGILLSGPPGCGKTLLARAIAGEAQVPFLSTAASSFIEIYVGTGAKHVRELYAAAREEAKNHPSKTAIVFIDEVDAVASSRKNNGNSEDLRTINALLHEMDGSNNKDENDIKIITIVATNNEEMLDSAFKRSGRIDLKYTIDDPRFSIKAREEILKIHSKDLAFRTPQEKIQMLHNLAVSSSGMSGADLAELLKKANRMSLNVNRKENFVTEEDINEAKMQILAGIKTDIEHTDYELRQTVAHEAGHAVTSMVLEKIFEGEVNKHKMPSKVLDFITNSARGNSMGATYFKPSEENKMGSKETCLTDIIGLYGGYAIESELFDTHSSGVSQDLAVATNIIENAVSKYDFGSEKHYLSLNSNMTKSLFSQEIKEDMLAFSKKGMSISKQIIEFSRPFIEQYVKELILNVNTKQTVSAAEFKEQFNKWLKNTNKISSYNRLCKNVKAQIDDFCSEKTKQKSKIGF